MRSVVLAMLVFVGFGVSGSRAMAQCTGCVVESYLDDEGNRRKRCDGTGDNACAGMSGEHHCSQCMTGKIKGGIPNCYCSITPGT